MNDSYPIEVTPTTHGLGMPHIKTEFGRITVLLGSNGTGKSRALKAIRGMTASFGQENRPVVYIEGGRVITMPSSLTYDFNTYNEFGTLARAQNTFRGRRLAANFQRNKDVFYLLERRSDMHKVKHSEAGSAWQANDSAGPCPVIEEDPLLRLFTMFSEVFPEIAIKLENENKELYAYKAGQRYSITELSDGERQVLFILADIALSAEPNSLVIADEPELNLNSQLASRLWDTIEGRLPDAVFVYATHNISFALRQSIDRVIALSGRGEPAVILDDINSLDAADARDLLGAIPAILASPAALGVEGEEASFDREFYHWILERTDVAVVPLGGCQDVVAATTRTGIWDRLASPVKLLGVIDRDYRPEEVLSSLGAACLPLALHEAESYFCDPQLIRTVAERLGTLIKPPTIQEIESSIRTFFAENCLRIAATRMSARASVVLSVSLQNAQLRNLDAGAIKEAIRVEAEKEAAKATGYVGGTVAVTIFEEELARCDAALRAPNIRSVLELCPGKELLRKIAPMSGCRDSAMLARAIYKHIRADEIPILRDLAASLQSRL